MKKEKIKITDKFSFFKKHKKIAVLLVCIVLFVSSLFFINYSRYVKDMVQTYYLRTKKFYFNSNRLTTLGKDYQSNPWIINDPNNYRISIAMNTKLNSLKVMTDDVVYDVSCRVLRDGKESDVAKCFFEGEGEDTNSMTRTISGKKGEEENLLENTDSFNIEVKPIKMDQLTDGDKVTIEIIANAITPYKQTLSGRFELVVGDYGVSYEIDDQIGRRYIDCIVTNTVPLEEKIVELTIAKPDEIIFDQNNSILDVIKKYDQGSYTDEEWKKIGFGTTVDENGYINKIRFKVEEKSSRLVRFYKRDLGNNYTFISNSFNPNSDENAAVKMRVLNIDDLLSQELPEETETEPVVTEIEPEIPDNTIPDNTEPENTKESTEEIVGEG